VQPVARRNYAVNPCYFPDWDSIVQTDAPVKVGASIHVQPLQNGPLEATDASFSQTVLCLPKETEEFKSCLPAASKRALNFRMKFLNKRLPSAAKKLISRSLAEFAGNTRAESGDQLST
jgi:hypothetical protein